MTSAAIKATYADFKHIKTRKVLQIVLEVPAEQAEAALQMLGFPVAGTDRWVAVALLNEQHQTKERVPFYQLPLPKQAAIKCQDEAFCQWLGVTMDKAADKVRELCKIGSRSELATNHLAAQRWRDLLNEYDNFQYGG